MTAIKKYIHLLERLGMSEQERTIYLTLLEHPYLSISDIADKTRYHRPVVYRAIASLESDRYIEKSLLQWKRYFYHITSPAKLQEKVATLQTMADQIIPEMEELHKKHHDAPILSVHEGIEWIQDIHTDILKSVKHAGEYFIYTSLAKASPKRTLAMPVNYSKIQKEKELSRHIITNDITEWWEKWNPYEKIVTLPGAYARLDEGITKFIYANKVAILDHESHMGWIVENERFARYEEKIFRLLEKLLQK